MSFANYITLFRIVLIPVFVIFAWMYGKSLLAGEANEILRYAAMAAFGVAAIGDAVDGYVARKYNQVTKLGSYLDPIADKFLMFSAIMVLALVPWGEADWRIPLWFAAMVIIRDLSIATAVAFIYGLNKKVIIRVNISSKINTIVQLCTVGWVMLKIIPLSPLYPTMVSALFILFSSYQYVMETCRQLSEAPAVPPSTEAESIKTSQS
ncbi:CDP-alcohol phosphatidyltransferase family protein [Akkermansiaceae bacterium]|nr:CDP-alcohol phosphatidyltransferase family protein [Akkermansiaceae bacterium]